MSSSSGPDIITNGLILRLDAFDIKSYPKSGTTWFDRSGNGNHGTLTNDPIFNNDNGGNLIFDGSNDHIILGDTSKIISASQSEITVNVWVKTNVINQYKKILVNVIAGSSSITGIYFSMGPSPYDTYFGITTSGGQNAAVSSQRISTTQYTNLCGTYDGSNIKLYLNGFLVATQPLTGTIGNTGITRISGYDSNTETWDGNISQVSIYNRALSPQEIKQNFNSTKGRYRI
jgi:hypothetical protein